MQKLEDEPNIEFHNFARVFDDDQDPQGHFIRRWVPELARVPLPYLAEPWKMDASVQHMAGCTIGVDYPAPIVDDKVAMKAAKDRMYGLRQSPAARKPTSPSPQGDLFA
jgi:deoxyribodipyrimidine photolyase